MTRRQERVNGRIVEEVSLAIRTLKDPRIGFVTVTKSDVSPDLRHAKVYISVFDKEEVKQKTFEALQHGCGHIRNIIGHKLGLKVSPRIEFHLDNSMQNYDDINALISEARAGDINPPTDEDSTEEDDDVTNEDKA